MQATNLTKVRIIELWLAASAGASLAGLWIANLTLAINPDLAGDRRDAVLLLTEFAATYSLAGAAVGGVGALIGTAGITALGGEAARRRLHSLLVGIFLLAPLCYCLMLPDAGLFPRLLTDLLSGRAPWFMVAGAWAGAVIVIWSGGVLLAFLADRLRRFGRAPHRWGAAAWVAAVGVAAAWGVAGHPTRADDAKVPAAHPPLASVDSDAPPPIPVLLLCIDGADLDEMIHPLAAGGELPTLSRLIREGTSGPLATIRPTLSPAVWTTLATGKPPAVHGIHHFVYFPIPGLRHPVRHFPVHAGLNFQLFPLLERVTGLPSVQRPYTSDMRRVPALWNIVARRWPVGVWQWLNSWPAESLPGFYVAGSKVGWFDQIAHPRYRSRAIHPPEASDLVEVSPSVASPDDVARYLSPGSMAPPQSPGRRVIESSLTDPTAEVLPRLVERFEPRFIAAAFYTVDSYQHLFAADREDGGPFGPAIEEAYRHTDARLGQLLERLPSGTNLIIVSDHGFDFRYHHHTAAPPGLFLAHGPAFRKGVRVEGLSIYDVAPLVLHLMGLPLALDMPGTANAGYRQVLSPDFLAAHRAGRVSTYGMGSGGDAPDVHEEVDEELLKTLKSLGYL
jgi:hypothetical protein